MNKIFKSSWFQVIFFGMLIGLVLILLDNKFRFFDSNKNKEEGLYHGPIEIEKSKTYFTKAQYSELEYNFGKVKEGDTVKHIFKLKNTGQEPLMIYKTRGSCDCITAIPSREVFMPDSTAEIFVFFNTKGRKGPQTRTVSIITNTESTETILTLKGEVE